MDIMHYWGMEQGPGSVGEWNKGLEVLNAILELLNMFIACNPKFLLHPF